MALLKTNTQLAGGRTGDAYRLLATVAAMIEEHGGCPIEFTWERLLVCAQVPDTRGTRTLTRHLLAPRCDFAESDARPQFDGRGGQLAPAGDPDTVRILSVFEEQPPDPPAEAGWQVDLNRWRVADQGPHVAGGQGRVEPKGK